MTKVSVIVAAAGKSERFRNEEKKTFAKLDGRPVFLRALELFVTRQDVCQTILAVAPEDLEMVKTKFGPNLSFMTVKLVEGGTTRAETVHAALQAVDEQAELVAVHDAVRPCTEPEYIDAVFAAAERSGAAILGCPVTATLKRVDSTGAVAETVPRQNLYEAQTPQVFRKQMIQEAYARLGKQDGDITDDAMVVEQAGHRVAVVESDATNLKITTKADLSLAAAVLKFRPVKKAPKFGAFEEAQW